MKFRFWLSSLTLLALLQLLAVQAFSQPLIYMPFNEGVQVRCVQGNNGAFSHSGNLQYAYDFDMGRGPNSPQNPAFGLRLYSPVNGTVEQVKSGYRDFYLNDRSVAANGNGTGNMVVIRFTAHDGRAYLMRFMHLRDGSIPAALRAGATVSQGLLIGQIGQSGYSTSPHLHFDVAAANSPGRSVLVDFVEGPMRTGDYVTSLLKRRRYIIDNSGRFNAGAPLRNASAGRVSGTWNTMAWVRNTIATNFATSTSSNARFRWNFGYIVPANSDARMMLYGQCPSHTNRDRSATYTIQNGAVVWRVDQRYMSSPTLLARLTFRGGGVHNTVVEVQRSGNTLCADALILDHL